MFRSLVGFLLFFSFVWPASAEPVKENIGLYGGYVADIAAVDDAGATQVLIAVENSQRGVYRYDKVTGVWGSETNPPGSPAPLPLAGITPGFASQIEVDIENPTYVYATLSNEQTFMNRRLYSHSDYGRAVGGSAVWQEVNDPVTGAQIDDVVILHGYSYGMYFAQRATTSVGSISVINGISSSMVISTVFQMSDISALTTPFDWEIVDFSIAGGTNGYVAIRHGSTDEYRLYALSASSAPVRITLPSASPVKVRTGSCPISDCDVKVELVAFDPADSTGNTVYIAGSSVNPMVFKSLNGGLTWDSGADYQCSLSTDPSCSGGEFFDGYPRGDVVRFKGAASSGTESRHVFIARTVFDNDNPSTGWEVTQKLSTTIMSSGVPVTIDTNANDPAIELDPNDPNKVYISTDLAIGEVPHVTDYLTAGSGTEIGAAQGIEGLVINDLDYFEITSSEKNLWIATKSGAAFAPTYDPTNPSSVATSADWVFPVFAGGDGAPHRAVVIDPNDKTNVLIGTGSVYRNVTGDGIDPSTGTYDPALVANATNWTKVFNPEDFDDDPSTTPGTTHPLFSDNVRRSYATAIEWQTSASGSCDRAYLSIANTDEGLQGGIFYTDDDGASWQADTLGSGRFSAPVNTLISNDNFLWAGVGDEFGRSTSTLRGIYARVSLCATNDWWKPTHSDPIFTAIQSDDVVVALDGASTPGEPSITARAYIGSNKINGTTYRLTKAELTTGGSCSGFNCWQFTDVTPPTIYGEVSAVALEPTDTNHVWVAYSNCIKESTDGGITWADFGGACTSDHENVVALVYDDLIAGTSQGAYAYTEDTTDDGVADEYANSCTGLDGAAPCTDDRIEIATLAQLRRLSERSQDWVATATIVLTADIDAGDTSTWNEGDHDNDVSTAEVPMGFLPIGDSSTPFKGVLDGAGYVISNLFIQRSSIYNVGLFGVIDAATIEKVALTTADITGLRYVGGLAGRAINGSEIRSTYVTGSIEGATYNSGFVGGLVGYIEDSSVHTSYATSSVTGESDSGGLVGGASGVSAIMSSYATGAVSQTDDVGGLVGFTEGSSITDSYWNTETSGQAQGVGLNGGTGTPTGLTNAQMVLQNSFSGFAFYATNQTDPVSNTPWVIIEGATQPYLYWQDDDGDGIAAYLDDDDDNDGLGDNVDQCNGTPAAEAEAINASGCGPSERDTDGDGTNDALDAFPNDPNETLDSDGDGYGDNEETEAGTDPNDADDQPIQSGLPIWLLYEASQP